MSDWFYRGSDASVKGPISPAQVLELIRNGVIQEKTLVRKGSSPWVASIEINGLWAAAARPSVVFACPQCNKPIAKPPIRCPHCLQQVEKATGRLVHHRSVVPQPTQNSFARNIVTDAVPRFGSRPGLYD